MSKDPALEEGSEFSPRYGADGLVAVVCTDAVALTIETGYAHF